MNDIEILENMRDNIYGAMQFEDDYQVSELEEKEFHALNSAITALKERQADKDRIKELEKENLHWKGQYHLLSRKIDVIPKSLVKEKIKELTETKGDFATYIATSERKKVLQELLGESND